MDIPIAWWAAAGLSTALALSLVATLQLYQSLKQERFRSRSQSSRYGKLTEQFMPFIDNFPWDAGSFRFLGSPIDGVQFEDDRIILVEFKAANSRLSPLQRHIRDLVTHGKVSFEVIRVG